MPTGNKKNKGSPIITQILNSLMELELSILNGEILVNSIAVAVVEKRRKTNRLLQLQKESVPMLKEVDAATEERDGIKRSAVGSADGPRLRAA